MDYLEYRQLKKAGLIKLDGDKAVIDRSEITVIDKEELVRNIEQRKLELDILIEVLTDLP